MLSHETPPCLRRARQFSGENDGRIPAKWRRERGRNLPGGKLRNLTIGLFKSLRQRTVADT